MRKENIRHRCNIFSHSFSLSLSLSLSLFLRIIPHFFLLFKIHIDAAPSEVKSTTLFLSDSKSWSPIGYYHDCSEVPQQMTLNDKDCTDSPNSGSMFSASSYSSKSKSNSTSAAVAVTPDETFITKKDYSSSNDSNNIHVNNYNTSNIKYSNLHSYSRSAIGNTTSISTSISNSTSNVTSAVTSSLSFVKPPLGPTGLKRLPLGVLKNSGNSTNERFQYNSDILISKYLISRQQKTN